MKKIIALALVAVMAMSMTTVAFAAAWNPTTMDPGEEYTIANTEFATVVGATIPSTPNDADTHNVKLITPKAAYFTSEYFSLSYKVERGRDLVESVKFDGDGNIVVKFKANFSLEKPAIENFKFDSIKVKAIKEAKADETTTTFTYATATTSWTAGTPATADGTITRGTEFTPKVATTVEGTAISTASNALTDAFVGFDASGTTQGLFAGSSITITGPGFYKFDKSGDVAYKDITIKDGDFFAELRVYEGDSFYYNQDRSANLDLIKANPDAEISFYNFKGSPSFSSSAKVEIGADKDTFIYELKDGKVLKTNLKWDDSLYAFTGRVAKLGSYVVSDIELKNAANATEDDDTKNPNTGANDFVGVAVALAVVSLVAAGAVSLKK